MNNAIFPLFAYPLMVCAKNYEFSTAEKKFISELKMIENTGNLMSENDNVLKSTELSNLIKFVDLQIFNFKKNLLKIKDENEIYVTQSWVNTSDTNQFHPKHKHPNSIISGVLFLDDDADQELPALRFHRTQPMFPLDFSFDDLNEFNANCREFDTVEGMLLLFPSLLEHDVEANKSDRMRSSISFNTFVRGAVGGKEQLTEVLIS